MRLREEDAAISKMFLKGLKERLIDVYEKEGINYLLNYILDINASPVFQNVYAMGYQDGNFNRRYHELNQEKSYNWAYKLLKSLL